MAEIGLAASVIQIANLGLSTAQGLYKLSQSVSTATERINRLAEHVESNGRILEILNSLLNEEADDSAFNGALLTAVRQAVASCEHVFSQIDRTLKKIGTPTQTESRVKDRVKEISKNVKYSLLEENQVTEYRLELNQCQVSLNLILSVHWRAQYDEQRQKLNFIGEDIKHAVVNILREGLELARHSQVSSISNAVETSMRKVAASRTTPPQEEVASESDCSKDNRNAPRGGCDDDDRSISDPIAAVSAPYIAPVPSPQADAGTSKVARSDIPSFYAQATTHKSLPIRQFLPARALSATPNRRIVLDSDTVAQETMEPQHTKQNIQTSGDRTMWIVKPDRSGSQGWTNPSFELNPIARTQKDAFALQHASKLLSNLAALNEDIYEAIRHHAKCSQHELVAIQVHRRKAFLSRRNVTALDLLTESLGQASSTALHSGIKHARTPQLSTLEEPKSKSDLVPHGIIGSLRGGKHDGLEDAISKNDARPRISLPQDTVRLSEPDLSGALPATRRRKGKLAQHIQHSPLLEDVDTDLDSSLHNDSVDAATRIRGNIPGSSEATSISQTRRSALPKLLIPGADELVQPEISFHKDKLQSSTIVPHYRRSQRTRTDTGNERESVRLHARPASSPESPSSSPPGRMPASEMRSDGARASLGKKFKKSKKNRKARRASESGSEPSLRAKRPTRTSDESEADVSHSIIPSDTIESEGDSEESVAAAAEDERHAMKRREGESQPGLRGFLPKFHRRRRSVGDTSTGVARNAETQTASAQSVDLEALAERLITELGGRWGSSTSNMKGLA
ncbi:MAG: hypothetical protein M1828_006376 [Chrysothrix sp. TS-e1954]|nr:MAG: hypothetical protein M1828_006376 [Chrysothrix sp. TS-e1954]